MTSTGFVCQKRPIVVYRQKKFHFFWNVLKESSIIHFARQNDLFKITLSHYINGTIFGRPPSCAHIKLNHKSKTNLSENWIKNLQRIVRSRTAADCFFNLGVFMQKSSENGNLPQFTFLAWSGYFSRTRFRRSHMVVKTLLYCHREFGCKGGCMSASIHIYIHIYIYIPIYTYIFTYIHIYTCI